MPKAKALLEAKRWLRNLSTTEEMVLRRRLQETAEGLDLTTDKVVRDAGRPFQDPRYWAAFVLVGLGK